MAEAMGLGLMPAPLVQEISDRSGSEIKQPFQRGVVFYICPVRRMCRQRRTVKGIEIRIKTIFLRKYGENRSFYRSFYF